MAFRSSQLIGEKKTWFLISICEEPIREEQLKRGPRAALMQPGAQTRLPDTYKVLLAAQPLGPVLLQQALQQVSGRVGNVGFQLQRLVEDVVVHFRCVTAVERRLAKDERDTIRFI